jgi:hypothetical protein
MKQHKKTTKGDTPVSETSEISEWEARFTTALDNILDLTNRLSAPPPGGDQGERVEALLRVWNRVVKAPSDPRQVKVAAEMLTARIANGTRRDDVQDTLLQALRGVERGITAALDAGAEPSQLVATKDFGDDGLRYFAGPWSLPTGEPVAMVAGLLSHLPEDHRLRTMVSDASLYQHGGNEPALVLGPVDHAGRARAWYALSEVLRLTPGFRASQLRKAEQATEDEKRGEAEARRKWYESDAGQLHRKLEQLRQLREAGAIPEPVPAVPAVREGRGETAAEPVLPAVREQ